MEKVNEYGRKCGRIIYLTFCIYRKSLVLLAWQGSSFGESVGFIIRDLLVISVTSPRNRCVQVWTYRKSVDKMWTNRKENMENFEG